MTASRKELQAQINAEVQAKLDEVRLDMDK